MRHLIRLPSGRTWINYDEEPDVLYVSLKRPRKATDTEFLENRGILTRYRNKELVGVAVLDASKRRNGNKKRVKGRAPAVRPVIKKVPDTFSSFSSPCSRAREWRGWVLQKPYNQL